MLTEDFIVQKRKRLLDTFLYQHELHSINENPTCYKNPNNSSNIDLNLSPIEITGSLMKTILMKIFIINFPQSNHKIMLLLEKYFYQF